MTTGNNPTEPGNSVSEYYDNYAETQKEVLGIKTRKTRNSLFTLAAIVFASDLLSLMVTNTVMPETILIIAVIPAALTGLAFLANKEPLTAMIIAAVIIVGLWVYSIVITGGKAAIMGWLIKAVIVYLILAGFQHAREAARIKKELQIGNQ